jgi:hypothetical protein
MKNILLESLNPSNAFLLIKGKEYKVKHFNLTARVWAFGHFATTEQPNGLLALSDHVANLRSFQISEMIYFLLESKGIFNSLEEFIESFETETNLLNSLLPVLVKTIGISAVEINEEEDQLKK